MPKPLILAEKPSVARDFAKALGKASNRKGYIETPDYYISWAVGHLVEIDLPKVMKGWTDYPVFPKKWEYKVAKGKIQQFNAIKNLAPKVSEVIIATDPGREGELIARLIINLIPALKKKPIYRFWSSESLDKQVVLKGLKNLRPSEEFDSLYQEALARQHADCLVGINCSRVLTVRSRSGKPWSAGRVQTPVLKIICERKWERDNFKPQKYFILKALFDLGFTGNFIGNKAPGKKKSKEDEEVSSRIMSKKLLDQIIKEVDKAEGEIVSVKKVDKSMPPPLLFNLTNLQREANKRFGLSMMETAKIAQKLYDTYKCISYPRTSSRHLGTGNKGLVKKYLKAIGAADLVPKVDKVGKRVFDDSKLSDHHALVPSKKLPASASKKERMVYELIEKSFKAAFMPNYEYSNLTVLVKVGKYYFKASEKTDKKLGWRALYVSSAAKGVKLNDLKKGTKTKVEKTTFEEKETKPPPLYTDESLLEIMENVHKLIEDKELKKVLREEQKGLGTDATRAGIVQALVDRGYIQRVGKKAYDATPKGEKLIRDLVKDSPLADPLMTAEWEKSLSEIRLAKQEYRKFIKGIEDFTEKLVGDLASRPSEDFKVRTAVKCPKCGEFLAESRKALYCPKEECDFVIWPSAFGKTFTSEELQKLATGERTLIRGLVSKRTKKKYDAFLTYDFKEKKYKIDFEGVPKKSFKRRKKASKKKSTSKADKS